MSNGKIYVSELSSTKHTFSNYHFCRGNNNKRKTRIGIILKGSGKYIYLNKTLYVTTGDVVFIPENIYCYSEWRGDPEIEVVYVSCFMHYEEFRYEPQIIECTENVKEQLRNIARLLSLTYIQELEAYSLFYKVLQNILPLMRQSDFSSDKTLLNAIQYITDNWDKDFHISDVAKKCCISESTLYHLFQKELGQTPIGYLNFIKINHAIKYLENSKLSVTAVSQAVGFHSENHFRKVFKDITGTTPLKFRKN